MTSLSDVFGSRGTWVMCLPTWLAVLKLKGTTSGDYLFTAGVDQQGRPLLAGRPVVLCPSMPSIAALAKVVAYGDFSKLFLRRVRNSLRLAVSAERWAEFAQLGAELSGRFDVKLAVTPNSMPIRLLAMHS